MNELEESFLLERKRETSTSIYMQMFRCFHNSEGKKPHSLPKNWPHPTPEDLEERPNRHVKIGSEQDYEFHTNFVKTSKYEIWNFFPKFLLEEFNPRTKVANCYFLAVAAMQCVKQISNTNGYPTTLLPLFVVVTIVAIFQIVDDVARHKADAEANSSPAYVYHKVSNEYIEVTWAEIKVGDVIKIENRAIIPADVVILSVAEKNEHAAGICYVETKSLDGETNLKIRNAIPSTCGLAKDHSYLANLNGEIEMEHPNKVIEQFSGIVDLGNVGRESIQTNQVLLRGCVLRNTDWVIGVVVNTGHDTKIMMSATETPSKFSNLDVCASNEIKRLVLLLLLVCLVGASGEVVWMNKYHVEDMWYLRWKPSKGREWVIQFFYFVLLHSTFIPVSLYVSMSVTRFVQAYFMNNDLEMYYEKTDTPAQVRTMTLNEELGQISHIFSDKTGTLTCNIMDFRKCSINGSSYGVGITEIGKAAWKLQGKEIPDSVLEGEAKAQANAVPHVSFYCPNYESDFQRGGQQKENIFRFFKLLALCHDVIPERVDGKIKLSASNPDDEALVCAAKYFGFEFKDRREKLSFYFNRELNREESVEVLETIEFTSKRKRMSVILRDTDGAVRIFCKGADTMMLDRLGPNQDSLTKVTEIHMKQFAVEGLRCLIVGYAEIASDKFLSWHRKYREACSDLVQIEKRKKNQPNDIEDLQDLIEQNLVLIGATAIEDRLQDGVPECISELVKAGINIWMLTGDKEETAINIAVACNLVQPKEYMEQIIINKSTASHKQAMLDKLRVESKRFDEEFADRKQKTKPRALIIDGPSLLTAMDDTGADGVKDWLLTFSKKCRAVIGCRVSPDQKRQMVHLVKAGVPGVRTLSVGDGANDVAMIQEAHIGVGIKGEEGVQAVNASDFAIAQFRYLSPLLLKHGRFNYIRMTKVVMYMFYKNIFMSICQHFFAYLNGFSGQKIYPEAGIQMYNLLFTSIPIILLGVADMDVSPKSVYRYPQLYIPCIKGEFFSTFLFWTFMLNGICEAVFVTFMSSGILIHGNHFNGQLDTFLHYGSLILTSVILIVNAKICFLQNQFHWIHILGFAFSILSWWAVVFGWESRLFLTFDYDWNNVWTTVNKMGGFWMGLLLMVAAVVLKDVYLAAVERDINPKAHHIVQELEKIESRGSLHLTQRSILLSVMPTMTIPKPEEDHEDRASERRIGVPTNHDADVIATV